MTFRVGQKVVCVDDVGHGRYTPFPAGNDLEGLTKGEVYTILYVGVSFGGSVVRIEEIRRRFSLIVDDENFYAAARFRPVVESKTDISIFKKMLIPAKGRQLVS